MKECLKCKKDISEKHESAKFCSVSCRVMWNRKNGNQNKVKPIQVQVLFNQISEMVDRLSSAKTEFKGILPHENGVPEPISHTTKQSLAIKRTPAHWVELRRECETADDYAKWLEDLENDTFLTTREKSQIKQTV